MKSLRNHTNPRQRSLFPTAIKARARGVLALNSLWRPSRFRAGWAFCNAGLHPLAWPIHVTNDNRVTVDEQHGVVVKKPVDSIQRRNNVRDFVRVGFLREDLFQASPVQHAATSTVKLN